MSALILTFVALGTLAFGAVYPWAYLPLFFAAAAIGVTGIIRGGIVPSLRSVAIGLLVLWTAVAIQLIPLPAFVVQTISPSIRGIASKYDLGFSPDTYWLRLSIEPALTRTGLIALGALSLYMLGLPSLLNGRDVRRIPRGLALIVMPLALFVVFSREHNNGLIYGFWRPLDGGGADQAGPFINRNHFGGWITMSLCIMVGWLLGRIEGLSTAARAPRRRLPVTDDVGAVLLMGTAVVLGTISLFWIVSRSGITSFGIAMALFAWLVLKRRSMSASRRTFVFAVLAVVLLAGVTSRGIDILARWFVDERSLLSRIDAWRDGWQVVRDFPVLGTGLNTYSRAMLVYQKGNPGFHMAQAHNDYLQLLAEGGLIVAVVAVVTAALLIVAIRRALDAAQIEVRGYWIRAGSAVGLMAIAFQEIVEFSLQIPANAFLFCTLVAITVTSVRTGTPGVVSSRGNIVVPEDSAGAALS
jgi:hypothetical protein